MGNHTIQENPHATGSSNLTIHDLLNALCRCPYCNKGIVPKDIGKRPKSTLYNAFSSHMRRHLDQWPGGPRCPVKDCHALLATMDDYQQVAHQIMHKQTIGEISQAEGGARRQEDQPAGPVTAGKGPKSTLSAIRYKGPLMAGLRPPPAPHTEEMLQTEAAQEVQDIHAEERVGTRIEQEPPNPGLYGGNPILEEQAAQLEEMVRQYEEQKNKQGTQQGPLDPEPNGGKPTLEEQAKQDMIRQYEEQKKKRGKKRGSPDPALDDGNAGLRPWIDVIDSPPSDPNGDQSFSPPLWDPDNQMNLQGNSGNNKLDGSPQSSSNSHDLDDQGKKGDENAETQLTRQRLAGAKPTKRQRMNNWLSGQLPSDAEVPLEQIVPDFDDPEVGPGEWPSPTSEHGPKQQPKKPEEQTAEALLEREQSRERRREKRQRFQERLREHRKEKEMAQREADELPNSADTRVWSVSYPSIESDSRMAAHQPVLLRKLSSPWSPPLVMTDLRRDKNFEYHWYGMVFNDSGDLLRVTSRPIFRALLLNRESGNVNEVDIGWDVNLRPGSPPYEDYIPRHRPG